MNEQIVLVANMSGMVRSRSLGVGHFAFNLLKAMKESDQAPYIHIVVDAKSMTEYENVSDICDNIVLNTEIDDNDILVQDIKSRRTVSFQPHHFQPPIADLKSVAICHDLHVYDIGWKYRPLKPFLDKFHFALESASAIVTEFPRTYEDLPSVVEGTRDKLFLTDYPTLLDDIPLEQKALEQVRATYGRTAGTPLLIYPAQLAEHKNHYNLVSAIGELRDAGRPIRLICPGSHASSFITRRIMDHISELELETLISVPGYISGEHLRALYEICDGVISPSLAEGGANIAQEAILYNKPVASSNIKAARLHLERLGAEVPLFDPFNVDETVESIVKLIDDGANLVQRNTRVRDRLSSLVWGDVASRFLGIFNWVADGCLRDAKPIQKELAG